MVAVEAEEAVAVVVVEEDVEQAATAKRGTEDLEKTTL